MGNFTPNTLVDDVNVLMVHFPPWSTLCTAISSTKLCKTAKCTDQQTVIFVKVFSLQNIDKPQFKHKLDTLNSTLSKLPNRHILLSFLTDSENLGLLYRPYIHSSLRQKLIRPPFLNTEEKLWIGFLLLKSIHSLHEAKIIHGDIRPENFLITSWDWVFISDLGFYKPLSIPEGDLTTYNLFFAPGKREACYLAPERFDSRKDKSEVALPADVFALGCVMSEVFLDGESLFTMSQVLQMKKSSGKCQKLNLLNGELRVLIENMICCKQEERWDIGKCLDFYCEKIVGNSGFDELYLFCVDILKKNNVDDRVLMVENWIKSKFASFERKFGLRPKTVSKHSFYAPAIPFSHSIILLSILTSSIRNVSCPSLKIKSAKIMTHLPLTDEAKLHRVLPQLTSLLTKEEKSPVKCAALNLIPKLLSTIHSLSSKDIHLFKECIWPFVSVCKNDESDYVRYTLAVLLPKFALMARKLLEIGRFSCKSQTNFDIELKTLGKMMGKIYREMLDKEEESVHFILLSNFPYFASHLGPDLGKIIFKEVILPKFIKEQSSDSTPNLSDSTEQIQISILTESEKYIEILGTYFFTLISKFLENNLFGKSEILVYLTLKAINLNGKSNLELLEKTLPYLLHPSKWIQKEMKNLLSSILEQIDPIVNLRQIRPMVLPFLRLPAKSVFVIELELIESYLLDHIPRCKFKKQNENFSVEDGLGALSSLITMVKLPKAKSQVIKPSTMPEERIYYEETYSNEYYYTSPPQRLSLKTQFYEGLGLTGELDHVIESNNINPVTHLLQTNENLILSAYKDGKVVLYKLSRPDEYVKIKYKEKKETASKILNVGNCGDYIFLAYSNTVKIWDQEFSQVEEEFKIDNLTQACELGDNLLLATNLSGSILIKDLRDPKIKTVFELGAQKGIISSLLKTSDDTVALGSISGHLMLFDLRFFVPSGSYCNSFKQPILTMANYNCKYKPIIDGEQLLMGLSNDVIMWDLLTMRPSVLFTKKSPIQVPFLSPEPFCYTEYRVESGSPDYSFKMEKLELYSRISTNFVTGLTEFGPLLKKSWENRSNILKILVPQDSNLILSTGEDALVHVWDPICIRNSCIFGLGNLTTPDYQSAIMPDLLVVQEQTLPPSSTQQKRRDFDDFNPSRKASHSHTINDLLFITRPKPLLITGSNDGSIRIWR